MTAGLPFGPRNKSGATAVFVALSLFSSVARTADPLIGAEDCRQLVTHVPAPDVAYKPGVDLHGKPVIEADLAPPAVTIPENFSFDITIDAARAAGLPVPPGTETAMKVGTVTYENGALKFNGKPLEGEQEAQLKALCAPQERPSK